MTEEQKQEWEDWQALIHSDGWKRFAAWAERDWASGEAFKRRALSSLNALGAQETVSQMMAATKAVESVIGYPKARLEALSREVPAPDRFAKQRRVP